MSDVDVDAPGAPSTSVAPPNFISPVRFRIGKDRYTFFEVEKNVGQSSFHGQEHRLFRLEINDCEWFLTATQASNLSGWLRTQLSTQEPAPEST